MTGWSSYENPRLRQVMPDTLHHEVPLVTDVNIVPIIVYGPKVDHEPGAPLVLDVGCHDNVMTIRNTLW